MPTKSIKVPQSLTRAAIIERDGESLRVSISSDTPYRRYDFWNDEEYYEVLDHSPAGMDDSRLKAGLPILFNHSRDQHLARAGGYSNDGHKLTLDAKDFKWAAGEFAENKRKDMESGALPDTSVGYELIGEGICVGAKDEIPVYRFKWRLFEASLVTIPADASVGVGRSRAGEKKEIPREITISIDENPETPQTKSHTPAAPFKKSMSTPAIEPATETIDVAKERTAALAEFRARCKKITEFVRAVANPNWRKKAEEIAGRHIEGDANFDDFRTEALNSFTVETAIDTPEASRGMGQILAGNKGPAIVRGLSLGQSFVKSKGFQEAALRGSGQGGRNCSMDFDYDIIGLRGKMNLQQRAGWSSADLASINVAPQSQLVALGVQMPTVLDLISPGTTSAAAIPYPVESTLTLSATSVGEGGVKPNWDPDLTTATANVRKIAVVTRVPDEFMADFAGFGSYIDQRLPYMVDIETDRQALYGDGLGNNLKGITTFSGILTRPYATSWADTIKKAITDVQVGSFFNVDGIVMHPYDWEVASLEKDLNGQYIAGGPYFAPYGNGGFTMIRTFWGVPVVTSTIAAIGKPIVGAWKLGAQYFVREGMRLETTNSNKDDFERNLVSIRAEHRLALACYRPPCFLEVTGGPART